MKNSRSEKKRLKEKMKQKQLKNGIILKKPFYKKWWFIALIVVIVIGAAFGGTSSIPENQNISKEHPKETTTEKDPPTPNNVIKGSNAESLMKNINNIYNMQTAKKSNKNEWINYQNGTQEYHYYIKTNKKGNIAYARFDVLKKDDEKKYLQECASLKYTDANIKKAQKFINKNIGDNKEKRIGNAVFKLENTNDSLTLIIKGSEYSDYVNKSLSSDYKTEIDYALDSNYMMKVADSSFDGDVINEGTYRLYPDNVSSFNRGEMIKEGTPIVWDVYISKNEYKNNNELKKDEYIGSIGGLEKDELIIDVEQDDYIYINYNNVVDKGLGTLKIEIVE